MIEKIAEVEGGLQEETTYDGRKLRWTEDARRGLWTMKNAYQRRRVKARVEKRAHEEAGRDHARLRASGDRRRDGDAARHPGAFGRSGARARGRRVNRAGNGAGNGHGDGNGSAQRRTQRQGAAVERLARRTEARLIARDDKKNPLISAFDWTSDATQRVFRVPAGFMRNKTQERIEELARERAVAAIDLALVEEGIEIGKRMMAEMIATCTPPGASAEGAGTARARAPMPVRALVGRRMRRTEARR